MSKQAPADRPPIAAVIVQDGRMLIVRRHVAEASLLWQFPAGEVEPGETFEYAVVREMQEETVGAVGVSGRPPALRCNRGALGRGCGVQGLAGAQARVYGSVRGSRTRPRALTWSSTRLVHSR